MNTILSIQHVKKSYRGRYVLDIDRLDIPEGAIYGLIGPNGAGKTTLMKAILGLIERDGGDIQVFGEALTPQNQKELNRRMGSLIENPSFYDHLTGYENMDIISRMKGADPHDVMSLLAAVGLEEAAHEKAKEYSLGMKQRLGIAIALIGKPNLLVLDEPINGLDPYGIEEMRHFFQRIVAESDTSILISSHILDEIEKIATHIAILEEGRLTYDGTLDDYRQLHPPFITMATSDNNKAMQLLNRPFEETVGGELVLGNCSKKSVASIVRTLAPHVDIYRVQEEKESLETLFIRENRASKGGRDNEKSRSRQK
ncbi:MAG: ATP-binding cassette domain-containing protein [Peptoniphilus sp.]|nr:ATP-binding cassette domain-containing protein [Peptoniphilus sp.]MDD7362652.1 ATP-binding cassette domain-containing protein [Bacillota bacterium]MDY6044949.1 ATP-binding cassette domain-containing protein [Peptoniphilus sp.]